MSTITVSLSGSGIVNGTKNYTISDSDLQILLNWAKIRFFAQGATPTSQQILLAWVQWWVDTTKFRVQQDGIVTTVPPMISVL